MSPREKKLGLAVLAVLLLFGGKAAWDRYQESLQTKRTARNAAKQALGEVDLELAKAKYAAEQVRQWEERSLPRNQFVAKSLYRSWLTDQLEAAKLRYRDVTPTSTGGRSVAYEGLAYNIEAEGDLPAVIRFLHAFHSSSALHKITLLSLRPALSGSNLQVTLNIEALLLPDTQRESGMPEGTSDRLAMNDVDHYLDNIVARDPFIAYKPPPPKVELTAATEEPKPPPFDESSQARLTGIVQAGPELQAWVKVLTTNENLRLIAGDELKVGALAGRVVEVRQRQMVIEVDGKRQIIRLGKSLRDGVAADGEI